MLTAAAGLSLLIVATAFGQNEPQVSQFKRIPGTAQSNMVPCPVAGYTCYPQSIAAGPNGTAWILGTAQTPEGDYYVYRRERSKWVKTDGAGLQISVGIDGYPWVITHLGTIYYWNGSTFVLAPYNGCATSIGVGPSNGVPEFAYGDPWIIGCNGSSTTDGSVYQYSSTGWYQWPQAAANRIAVSPQGVAVVATIYDSVWYANAYDQFIETPDSCAQGIAAGSNTDSLAGPYVDIWITFCGDVNNQGAKIFQYQNDTTWVQIPGVASQVSLAPDMGTAWVVTLTGEIFAN